MLETLGEVYSCNAQAEELGLSRSVSHQQKSNVLSKVL
jgi:hypothetical protein